MDEKRSLMASTSRLLMEKVPPTHEPPLYQQQQQQNTQKGLQCPRCDSSNTKFCYYNNYSLSQPRHFCKACKRYWTRGGTLRNVPVGGGCRKNKRSKRSASSLEGANTITSTSNTTSTNTSVSGENPSYTIIPTSQTQIDSISATSNHINPLLVGLPSNPSDFNIPFLGRFSSSSSRALSISMGEFDHLQPQLNALGLGFSSGLIMSGVSTSDVANNGFINHSKEIQEVVVTTTSNPLLPSYTSIFGSSSSPTMATLLASSFHKQKLSHKDTTKSPLVHFHTLTNTPFGGLQMNGHNEARNDSKGVKIEPDQSRVDWNLPYQNQMDPNGFSDPNSLCWNNPSNAVGAWHDPANIGPSVTSLI